MIELALTGINLANHYLTKMYLIKLGSYGLNWVILHLTGIYLIKLGSFLLELEGMARRAGQLLDPAESFGLRPRLSCAKTEPFMTVLNFLGQFATFPIIYLYVNLV